MSAGPWKNALDSVMPALERAAAKVQPIVRGGASGVAAAANHMLHKMQPGEAPAAAVAAAAKTAAAAPVPPVAVDVDVAAVAPEVVASASGGSNATLVFMIMLTLVLGGLLLARYETFMEFIGGGRGSEAVAAPIQSAAAPAAPPMMMEQTSNAVPAPSAGEASHTNLAATRRPMATARTMVMEQSYVEVAGASDADFEIVSKPH